MDTFLATVFLIICVLLMVVILLQKGRGVGLGGILGGGHSAFGTRTGDVLTWVTIVLTGVFLLVAVSTTITFRPEISDVRPPVLNPAPRPIAKAISVIVQPGTDKSEMYYTVDGSEPTRRSLRYDAPVRVEPGMTLKVRAFLTGWNPSEVVAGHYPPAGTTQPATSTATGPRPGEGAAPAPASGPASGGSPAVATRPAAAPATGPAPAPPSPAR